MQTSQSTTGPKKDIEQLKSLLAEQIKLARRGSVADLEPLAQQADDLIHRIARAGTFEQEWAEKLRNELRYLYEELNIILKDRLDAVGADLVETRKAKKTLKVYRQNT